MTHTRSFSAIGKGGAHIATPNNVRGPRVSVVLAVRGDGKKRVFMFIPSHRKKVATLSNRKRK